MAPGSNIFLRLKVVMMAVVEAREGENGRQIHRERVKKHRSLKVEVE